MLLGAHLLGAYLFLKDSNQPLGCLNGFYIAEELNVRG
jgi:hypothetical protein